MPVETIKPNTNNEDDDSTTKNNKRRHQNNKFAAVMTQSNIPHSSTLRRDILLSNFDKNMTVEKAKFEPSSNEEPMIIPPQSAPNIPADTTAAVAMTPQQQNTFIPSEQNVNMNNEANEQQPPVAMSLSPSITYTQMLRQSPSTPTLSPSTSTGTINLSSSVNDRRRLTQVRSEGNGNGGTNRKKQHNSNNKKQQKSLTHGGSASPAEVFHRNLVDAVSNVEDSDENEHYVYPFSSSGGNNGGGGIDHHYNTINTISSADHMTTNSIHRPLSVRSTPVTLLNDSIKRKNKSLGEWLKQTLYNRNAASTPMLHHQQRDHFDEEEEDWSGGEYYHTFNKRPKLRNYVLDHHPSSKPSLLSRWHESFNKTESDRSRRNYNSIQKGGGNGMRGNYGGGGGGGYTSDEEDAPLLLLKKQKRSSRNKKNCKNICRNWLLSLSSVIIGLFILIAYRAKPLIELTVDMDRVLATDKELIFDLKIQAENWNWWTIHVADADISVFAFSQIVPGSGIIISHNTNMSIQDGGTRGVDPAEYLGNLVHFDEPLSIKPNVFHPKEREAISQIRIKSPGADARGNERWSRMIRYPYGLVVRGVLKYRPIPLIKLGYPQSIAICNVTQVDPTTGTVSTDPDKTICAAASNQDQVDIFSRL